MSGAERLGGAEQNRLLAALPPEQYQQLLPRLEPGHLAFWQTLYEPGEAIRQVHFSRIGMPSLVVLEDGAGVEVATVGNEGMVGLQPGPGHRPRPCWPQEHRVRMLSHRAADIRSHDLRGVLTTRRGGGTP